MDINEVDEVGQSITLYVFIIQEWMDSRYDIIGPDMNDLETQLEVPFNLYDEGMIFLNQKTVTVVPPNSQLIGSS